MTKAYLDAHQWNQKTQAPLPKIDIFDSYHTRHGTIPQEFDSNLLLLRPHNEATNQWRPLHVHLWVVNKLPPPTRRKLSNDTFNKTIYTRRCVMGTCQTMMTCRGTANSNPTSFKVPRPSIPWFQKTTFCELGKKIGCTPSKFILHVHIMFSSKDWRNKALRPTKIKTPPCPTHHVQSRGKGIVYCTQESSK